ncbi:MAG: DNA repair protein RecO [Thermoanaerobaculaceae bacterium]|nr:DNA repair protein RecO [Thermoanaerobaculaceae bacterium]
MAGRLVTLHEDDAIVLTRHAFRERDWVVVTLTRGAGQVRLMARRARSLRSGQAQALEPLAVVHLSYHERHGSELATLHEVSLLRSAFALAAMPEAWAAAQVVAELALLYCPQGQRAEEPFRLVDHCLQHLASGGGPLATVHYAELWFLRLSGVLPGLDRCGRCETVLAAGPLIFDSTERVCVCPEHRPLAGVVMLPDGAAAWLRQALRVRLEAVTVPAPPPVPAWLASLRHQFTERDLASLAYLHALLSH